MFSVSQELSKVKKKTRVITDYCLLSQALSVSITLNLVQPVLFTFNRFSMLIYFFNATFLVLI